MGVPQRLLIRPVRLQCPGPMRLLAVCIGSNHAVSRSLWCLMGGLRAGAMHHAHACLVPKQHACFS